MTVTRVIKERHYSGLSGAHNDVKDSPKGFRHPQLIFSQNAIPRFELKVRGLPLSHLSIGQSMGEQAEIP